MLPTRRTYVNERQAHRFFGASAQFWLNLQAGYDVEEQRIRLAEELAAIRPYERAA